MVECRLLFLHDGGQDAGLGAVEGLSGHVPGVPGVYLLTQSSPLHIIE